jgi:hypothetical protein
MDPNAYISVVAQRVQMARGTVQQAQVGPVPAVVGDVYSSSLAAMGNLRLCVVAAVFAEVNAFVVRDFGAHASQFATRTTQGTLGFGTALLTVVGFVTNRVTPDGIQAATSKPGMQFAQTTRPVIVDLATGALHTFTGTQLWGLAMQNTFKQKVRETFPTPAEAFAQLQQGHPPGAQQAGYPPPGFQPPRQWQSPPR